jgi:hypothetical protein
MSKSGAERRIAEAYRRLKSTKEAARRRKRMGEEEEDSTYPDAVKINDLENRTETCVALTRSAQVNRRAIVHRYRL